MKVTFTKLQLVIKRVLNIWDKNCKKIFSYFIVIANHNENIVVTGTVCCEQF